MYLFLQKEFTSIRDALSAAQQWRFPEGTCCLGRIQKFLKPPFAVSVQLTQLFLTECEDAEASRTLRIPLLASVHLTELTDEWISDPVKRLKLKVGQLVKLRILPPAVLPHAGAQQQCQSPPLQATLRLSAIQESEKHESSKGFQSRRRPERLDDVKVYFIGIFAEVGCSGKEEINQSRVCRG